jgi:hypothetical protein
MPKMIEVEIDSVRVSLTNQQRIVILKEKNLEHYLPIWIGLYEAEAITIALQEIQVARPQTHDLLKTLIHALNAQLLRVEVISLQDDVFYGNLILEMDEQQYEVDCRPSDALALAARTRAPIFVSEDVMEKAGIIPEDDISKETSEKLQENKSSDVDDANLDIFEDFLQNINPDQLGKNSDVDDDEEEEDK